MGLLSAMFMFFIQPRQSRDAASTINRLSTSIGVMNKVLNIPQEALSAIEDTDARTLLCKVELTPVVVPDFIADSPVETSFVKFSALKQTKRKPLVLIHGFDSSLLEFRRVAPLLSDATDRDVYVVDVLGWGFHDTENVRDFSPRAKLEHMKSFIKQAVGGPCVLVGASLGGAVAIILAAETCPELVERVILIDAQGFIDGQGPSNLPDFFAKIGVGVLKTELLRSYANVASYRDSKTFATTDAMRIGRLHCLRASWESSNVAFLLSGGFVVSDKVPKVQQETLVIWGRNDGILSPENALRFQRTLPRPTLYWVEECGHVPHLEKAQETVAAIKAFLDR